MKIAYRGFAIEARRDEEGLHYHVEQISSGLIIFSGTNHDDDTIQNSIAHLKGVVDNYHEDPTAYETFDTDFGDDLPPDDLEDEPLESDGNEETEENYDDEL